MAYDITFSNIASSQFKRIKNKTFRERIACALEAIAENPLRGKPLQAEFKGCYSYRIGDYRVIYAFYKEKKCLGIMRIDHRGQVYR